MLKRGDAEKALAWILKLDWRQGVDDLASLERKGTVGRVEEVAPDERREAEPARARRGTARRRGRGIFELLENWIQGRERLTCS
jgi:hypothetical protein